MHVFFWMEILLPFTSTMSCNAFNGEMKKNAKKEELSVRLMFNFRRALTDEKEINGGLGNVQTSSIQSLSRAPCVVRKERKI